MFIHLFTHESRKLEKSYSEINFTTWTFSFSSSGNQNLSYIFIGIYKPAFPESALASLATTPLAVRGFILAYFGTNYDWVLFIKWLKEPE